MKNNKVLYGIIGIVALAIVNVVVFLSLKEYTTARWINIAGLNLSIIVFWGAGIITGDKSEKFLGYARFPIVAVYSVLTFIISALFILINVKSVTLSVIVQVILLGLFAIVMCTNTMANNASKNITNIDKANYNKVTDMAKRIELIMQSVDDREVYKKIEKAYDSVKNANVTLQEDSTQIDNDIMQAIGVLEVAVQSKNYDMAEEQVSKINNLIARRNQMPEISFEMQQKFDKKVNEQ